MRRASRITIGSADLFAEEALDDEKVYFDEEAHLFRVVTSPGDYIDTALSLLDFVFHLEPDSPEFSIVLLIGGDVTEAITGSQAIYQIFEPVTRILSFGFQQEPAGLACKKTKRVVDLYAPLFVYARSQIKIADDKSHTVAPDSNIRSSASVRVWPAALGL